MLEGLSFTRLVASAAIIYLTSWIVYCRFFHPLRRIPGPFLASISRAWIVYKTAKGDMEYTQRALHKKYGHLVRIAPNEVACSDPEAIKIIYGTKNVFPKTDYYDAWAPPNEGYVGLFPARDEKDHAERRRIVNNIYSISSVLESEEAIDSCTILFCDNMREIAKQKSVIDLSQLINMYTFDVLGELFYAKKFGFISERKDVGGYLKAIESLLPAFTIGGTLPSYLTKLFLLSSIIFSPSVRGALGAVKRLENASEAAILRRQKEFQENCDNKRDMLRKMLELSTDKGEELNFKLSHIKTESHSSLFAGADTTTIAINSIMYHLMRNPAAYKKFTAEIDLAVAEGRVSSPVRYTEAIKLPYLKACVNEGMRLHPSVGLTMPRHVPPGGCTISGFYFPEGYRIGVNAAVIHYDRDTFGQDADYFNPDRWIECDSTQMDRTMITFGAGTRTCIGKNISLSEIYKLVAQLTRDFHFSLVDPNKEWKTHNYWFNRQSEIYVRATERTHTKE